MVRVFVRATVCDITHIASPNISLACTSSLTYMWDVGAQQCVHKQTSHMQHQHSGRSYEGRARRFSSAHITSYMCVCVDISLTFHIVLCVYGERLVVVFKYVCVYIFVKCELQRGTQERKCFLCCPRGISMCTSSPLRQ